MSAGNGRSFSEQMREAAVKVEQHAEAVFETTVQLVQQSIQFGSEVTGAPGQPVDTGALRASFLRTTESPTAAVIASTLPYAKSIEDGLSYAHGGTPMTLRSAVGGFNSIRHTIENFDLLVAAAVKAQADG